MNTLIVSAFAGCGKHGSQNIRDNMDILYVILTVRLMTN